MKTELEKFSDQMALMEMCVQLEDEQKKIFDALPKLKDEFSKEAKAEFARLTKQAEAIEWKLAEARGEYLKTVEANRAEFARMEQSIKAKGTELTEYSKRMQSEVPPPVEQKIKAIFETLPRPANGKDGADGKDASLLTGFRGNWDADTTYKAGDWFTFRGSSYLVLRACKGQIPTKNAQGEPGAYYAVFAMSGAPGITPEGLYLPIGGGTINGNIGLNGTAVDSNISVYLAGSINGATGKYGFTDERVAGSGVTSALVGFSTSLGTAAASFTLSAIRHFSVGQQTFGAGSAVTTQVGFNVGATMVGATNNYAFRGLIASGANRYNLYMDGTAANYLKGALTVDGVVAIGNTVAAGVAVASTHKVTISIGGVTYYLLASNV
jgi:hypothetical protein